MKPRLLPTKEQPLSYVGWAQDKGIIWKDGLGGLPLQCKIYVLFNLATLYSLRIIASIAIILIYTRYYSKNSLWKNILLTVGCFAFAAGGYFILHDANTSWPTKVFGGIGSMIFFGCGGMFMCMMTLYNIITRIPFLIIYDDRLDIYEQRKRTYRTIYFKDVVQFRQFSIYSNKYIAIDYCTKPLMRKMEESSCLTKRVMKFNASVTGAIESIPVQNLTMRGKEICNTLNNRMKIWKSQCN